MLAGEAVIDATLTPSSSIMGALTATSGISGQISVKDDIDGDASAEELHLEAALTPSQRIGGVLQGIQNVIGAITIGNCSDIETYSGDYEVLPSTIEDKVLNTHGKQMKRDVTVFKTPYYETANLYGDTVYIG